MIFLDHNSTTPLLPEAFEAMRPWLTAPAGNPASAHAAGRAARRGLEDARERVAALLGASPDEVVFTSGATEANNLALFGLAGEPPGRVVASPVEHPCVAEPLKQLAGRGFTVEHLPVGPDGVVFVPKVPRKEEPPRLVTVMLANHETGAVQPVAEVAKRYRESPTHCDAAQAVGKRPVHFRDLGVAALTASAHKFNGPVGVGLLVVRRGTKLRPLVWGGHQQRGVRPGTESVALAAGLAAALDAAVRDMAARAARVTALRERFLAELRRDAEPVVLNGPEAGGLSGTVNVSFPGCRADLLLMKLDLAGVACSTGSACSSGSLVPSPVLRAMGVPDDVLRSAMRFSLGWSLAETEVEEAARRVAAAVRECRANDDDSDALP